MECQYANKINGIWNGKRISACALDIFKVSLGKSDTYKYMFAGNTAIRSNINPQQPNILNFLKRIKQPNISNKAWKKILKVEYKDNPFNKTKLLSEISTSWKNNKRNTKIEDEVIIESSDGKE